MVKAGVMALAMAALAMGGTVTEAAAAGRPGHAVVGSHGPAHAPHHGPGFAAFVPRVGAGAGIVSGPPRSFAPAPGPFVHQPYFATHHDRHRQHIGHGVYSYGYDYGVGGGPFAGPESGVTMGYFSSFDRCSWLADRVRHGGLRDWQRRYNACRDTEARLRRY